MQFLGARSIFSESVALLLVLLSEGWTFQSSLALVARGLPATLLVRDSKAHVGDGRLVKSRLEKQFVSTWLRDYRPFSLATAPFR